MTKTPNEQSGTQRVYQVHEITRLVKSLLERSFREVWVEGELSNVSHPASGHFYFTLKDSESQLSCVMFRSRAAALGFKLEDGAVVRAAGRLSVFEARGNYQLIVDAVEPGGQGALLAQFEALKKKLNEEGLFDASRKQPLPMLPRRVGVVTSPTGAAVRDILNVLNRRFGNLHVVLAPVIVQGATAGPRIAKAIRWFSESAPDTLRPDVLIVGRGGGSMEDLWCFNDESVARAIADCSIPVISAVGHEVDFTISDFVADLRAPTPSAAAELVVGRKEDYEQRIANASATISRHVTHALRDSRSRLNSVSQHHVFREPQHLVERLAQRLDSAAMRMGHALGAHKERVEQRLEHISRRMAQAIERPGELGRQRITAADRSLKQAAFARVELLKRQLDTGSRQLQALNPLAVLTRGYSLTRAQDGRIVRHVHDVTTNDVLITRVSDGEITSNVQESAGEEHDG